VSSTVSLLSFLRLQRLEILTATGDCSLVAVALSIALTGDPHRRRSIEASAECVQRWPVDRLITYAAGPRGVPAAVTETGLMTHEALVRAEGVPVGASRRRVDDPLAGSGLHQLAQHICKRSSAVVESNA
jgi:hypothetical protein